MLRLFGWFPEIVSSNILKMLKNPNYQKLKKNVSVYFKTTHSKIQIFLRKFVYLVNYQNLYYNTAIPKF